MLFVAFLRSYLLRGRHSGATNSCPFPPSSLSKFQIKTEALSVRSISPNSWRHWLLELPEIDRYRSFIEDDKLLSIVIRRDIVVDMSHFVWVGRNLI